MCSSGIVDSSEDSSTEEEEGGGEVSPVRVLSLPGHAIRTTEITAASTSEASDSEATEVYSGGQPTSEAEEEEGDDDEDDDEGEEDEEDEDEDEDAGEVPDDHGMLRRDFGKL